MAEEATLAEDGTLTFATRGLRRGAHQVLLLDKSGEVVSRAPFWIYRPGERTKVRTSKRVYEKGERIGVSWSNAPGMRWDWLAVYRVKPGSKTHYSTPGCNAGACGNGAYLVYEYTKTAIQGNDGVLPCLRGRLASAAGHVRGAAAPGRRLQLGGEVAALPDRETIRLNTDEGREA